MSVSSLFSLRSRRATAVVRRLSRGSGPISAPTGRKGAARRRQRAGPPRRHPRPAEPVRAGVAYPHCGAHRNRNAREKGHTAGPDGRAQTGGPQTGGQTGRPRLAAQTGGRYGQAQTGGQTEGPHWGVVTIDDVRALASRLPRSYEAIVADRVKFRVGRIVYLAFSRDERIMGFGFPKEERALLVSSEPAKFQMPSKSDMRYNWAHVRLEATDDEEMRELVLDAWQMVVPKKVAADYFGLRGPRRARQKIEPTIRRRAGCSGCGGRGCQGRTLASPDADGKN